MSQGSTIPNAHDSKLVETTITPTNWASHPKIEKSSLTSCSLHGLSSSTVIDRSRLTSCTLSATASGPDSEPGKSRIDRSTLEHSHIVDSYIDRSNVKSAVLSAAKLDRSNISGTNTAIEQSSAGRSNVENSQILGESNVERSVIKDSEVVDKSVASRSQISGSRLTGSTKADRSVIRFSVISASKLDRSAITGCEVVNCKLDRTNFSGMRLANGKWERGNLVGRIDETEEVLCEKIDVAQEREKREQEERERAEVERLQQHGAEAGYGYPVDEKMKIQEQPDAPDSLLIHIEHSPEISKHPDEKHEYRVTRPISEAGTSNSGVGWSTGVVDSDGAIELENYDGPRTQTPPPPYNE